MPCRSNTSGLDSVRASATIRLVNPVPARDSAVRSSDFALRPLTDLHTDALYEHVKGAKDITKRTSIGHLDIPRMKEAGVTGQVFAVWTNPEKTNPGERAPFVHKAIDALEDICRRYPDDIAIAKSPDEMLDINGCASPDQPVTLSESDESKGLSVTASTPDFEPWCLGGELRPSGRVAAILGIEGGHALEGDLANLDRFFERGVRVLTITWNNSNEFAGSCMDKPETGLTELGRRALSRMNELGMIVDLSHSSPRTFYDTLEVSTAPVICSHSACKARCDFPRNLDDDQLRALAQHRGVIGIVFLPYFLTHKEGEATLDDVLDHAEHAIQVAGIDSVALGSDFDGFGKPPKGLEDVTRLPVLLAGLRSRGYSDSDVAQVSGLNFLRLWREVADGSGIQHKDTKGS